MTIQEFSYIVNLLITILWQYNNAAHLNSLISQKQDWYNTNQQQFWTDWYNNVFNLQTADDFGLVVWSIILGLPLGVPIPSDSGPTWGFGSETMTPNDNVNFENGNFSAASENGFNLTTIQKRLILRLRYFQLTSRAAIPEINAFLKILFPIEGLIYLRDNLDMSITLYIGFVMDANLLFAIQQFDLIPRGAGVGIKYIIDSGTIWGFGSETDIPNTYVNFENGNFLEEF